MTCKGCGNEEAYRWRKRDDGAESCDKCSSISSPWLPDVYFKEPYLDPNLAHPDRPKEKDGVWVESRRHKAQLMKEQGLVEGGDKKHGARNFDASLSRKIMEQWRRK